jgi:hypothetical protein
MGAMIYGYIPLLAVVGLTIRFVVLKKVSVRSKCIVAGAALASVVAFLYFPTWRFWVILLQVAIGIFLVLFFKVVSDAE